MKQGSLTRGSGVFAIFAALLIALAVPAVSAARITVPPGSTEGDQYFEEVPNGAGSGAPNGGGTGGSGGSQSAAATQDLNALGADGREAAAVANANLPPQGGASNDASSSKVPPSNVPPSQAASSTEGDGGMGFYFPLLLIGAALAAAAFLLRSRLNPA